MGEAKVEKWKMYMEIHQLLKQGFSKTKVAKKLGISRSTLYRYIKRDPEMMSEWMRNSKTRKKILDDYEDIILFWLRENPDMTAAQLHDWLIEKHPSLEVAESTVRLYVRSLRKEYDIPKETKPRSYEAVPELPMGSQAQVDFGQTEQTTPEGKKEKLRFIAFVLAHSRYKYMEWLDRPFTTRDVITAHENAFRYFGGIPSELVYDQDALLIVSENNGDLILTKDFQSYKETRDLIVWMCRGADPESKGKVENVVKYVKNNFAKHRLYYGLNKWNETAWEWLERTGNYKHHNTTKKRPIEVFTLEKQHLRPISNTIGNSIANTNDVSSITRTVRKDNTINFLSNRYSVPLGTYHKTEKVIIESTEDNILKIYEPKSGAIIAKHSVNNGRGNLIQARDHRRDRSKGIDAYIETVTTYFSDKAAAREYLREIRKQRGKYIRDQLQLMIKHMKHQNQTAIDTTIIECINKRLFSATDFVDMLQYITQQQVNNIPVNKRQHISDENEQIQYWSDTIKQTTTQAREMDEYVSVLEGDTQ